MKILHIVNDLIRGGSEGQCARTAMGLQNMGTACRVAVFERNGFFLNPVEETCGPVYHISKVPSTADSSAIRSRLFHKLPGSGIINRLGALPAFCRWINDQKFDLIHTWDCESTVFGSKAAARTKTPLITSRRDLGQIYLPWKNRVMKSADQQAVSIVANCQAIADHFGAQGVDKEKIQVIKNILDVQEFDQLSAGGKEKSPDQFNLVCVSRLDPEKDHAMLLQAFLDVIQQQNSSPTPTLHIVGAGMEEASLRNFVREHHLEDRVEFHGERNDVPQLLQEMHLGVLTPKSNEGLSNTLLEYMAAGLPIIATDCGGNKELVNHGENGFIVPIGDHRALSEALLQLTEQREQIDRFARNSRMQVEQHHLPETILPQFKALYEASLGNH